MVGVVGRAELLCAIFFFLAILAYARKQTLKFILFTLCSSFSKEQGITIVAVCFVYELTQNAPFETPVTVAKPPVPAAAASCKRRQCPVRLKLPWKSFSRISLLAILGAMIVTYRVWIMGGSSDSFPVFTKFDNPASFTDFPTRHLTYNYLVFANAMLLLFPYKLCCDWTMKSIPLVESYSDVRNICTVMFYAICVIFFAKALREVNESISNKKRPKAKLALMLALLIFPFIPASNLIIPVGFVLAERVLYLPSAGFCLLVAHGIQLIYSNRHKMSPLLSPLLLITIFAFTLKTVSRSAEWRNEVCLCLRRPITAQVACA